MTTPNIVVLGVDHSGTTLVTRILEALGWQNPDADSYHENTEFRKINEAILSGCYHPARRQSWFRHYRLVTTSGPWVLKDPRLYATWDYWSDMFLAANVFLVALRRSIGDMETSYRTRHQAPCGFYGTFSGLPLRRVQSRVTEIYNAYPGPKHLFHIEDVARAASIVDVERLLGATP